MKTFFIKTYGCQMNELDSQTYIGILEKMGLKKISSEKNADLILYNTCSVRDLSERKVFGKLGMLSKRKKKAFIGVCGCLAMVKKESLLKKFPHIDFVIGTNNISDIKNILEEVCHGKKIIKTEDREEFLDYSIIKRENLVKAYLSIIRGCNNFCSYCIVPYTRGKERSKDPKKILQEAIFLMDKGYKEITLLGQNVNKYGKDLKTPIQFSDLLYELDKLKNIRRIRFLTSHPKDITHDLMYAIKDLPSVCEYVHFPIQSGSSKILKSMNRRYTKEKYLEKVEKLQSIIPNVHIGTDIIVGYPEEKEEDFQETLEVFKKVKFSNAFIFKYSPRKNTPAYLLKDLPENIKNQRMQILLNLYKNILKEESKKYIGKIFPVLIDSTNKEGLLKGRTRTFQKVITKGNPSFIGSIQNIQLEKYNHQTFIGKIL